MPKGIQLVARNSQRLSRINLGGVTSIYLYALYYLVLTDQRTQGQRQRLSVCSQASCRERRFVIVFAGERRFRSVDS